MNNKSSELRGILNKQQSEQHYHLARYNPNQQLAHFVEQYWIVNWDLTNKKSHLQENLPHPNLHLVIEGNSARIVGIISKKYGYLLEGKGEIFGVKFLPAAINHVLKVPFHQFIDSSITLMQAFDCCEQPLCNAVHSANSVQEKIIIIEKFLAEISPQKDDKLINFHKTLQTIENDHSITSVDLLVEKTDIHKRSLQRQFKERIGLSPKWMIRKYRLHQALHLLEQEEITILDLVETLDYSDQAHLINDFKNMLGVTPSKYINKY